MKGLILLRHAKSSWKEPTLDDFDRPLNKRGRENVPMMGQRLAAKGECPDVILSSPAKRARNTAHLVALELYLSKKIICFVPDIYQADTQILFEIVLNLDNAWQNVLMIGHNPGLTGLANLLAPCKIENIVSCGAVKLEFIVSNWKEIHPYSGFMHYYEYPKMISQW